MANIIVELTREMGRVRELLPQMSPDDRRKAALAIGFAQAALAMNQLADMWEARDDLREFKTPAAAPALLEVNS